MDDVSDIILAFENQLTGELKEPEKSTTTSLTAIIESYLTHEESSLISQKMCAMIERKLKEARTPQERLAYLGLIDSIVKQLPQSPYAKLFSVGIVSAFVAAVAATDSDSAREKMFEVRRSWIGIFPDSVMRELDLAVQAIDPGWPVLAEISTGSSGFRQSARSRTYNSRGRRPDDVDLRRSWSQYRRRTRQSWSKAGGGGGYVDLRQFDSAGPAPPASSLDQQQAAIEALLRRVQPESLGSEARRQLLGCVSDLQRLSAPGSSGRRLADSLAVTLGCSGATAEQIPEQVDSALDQLLSGLSSQAPPPQPPPQPGQNSLFTAAAASAPAATSGSQPTSVPTSVPLASSTGSDAAAVASAAPNFLQIGCDPRLLAPIKDRFEASRDILVNGEIKRLALDRIQPLIVEKGESRVVRFRFPAGAAVFLEWEGGPDPVRLRLGEFTKVQFGRRPFVVCLGGPGHELVIHGKPFNVPFNEPKLVPIRAGFFRTVYQVRLQAVLLPGGLPVTPALEVGPPIPGQWLQWANNSAFGGVSQLHKPPLNPLRSADPSGGQGRSSYYSSNAPFLGRLPPPPPMPQLPPFQQQHQQQQAGPQSRSSQPPDVLKMLNSLVRAGIVSSANRQTAAALVESAAGDKRRTAIGDATSAKRSRRTAGLTADSDGDSDSDNSLADSAALSADLNRIKAESATAPASGAVDYDSDVELPLDLTDLVEEKLEQRLPSVVYRLVGGFQCPQCTLRFTRGPQSASFRRHMDEHYRRRVWQRINPPAKCRAWYPHWSQLVKPVDEFSGAVLDYEMDSASAPSASMFNNPASVAGTASSMDALMMIMMGSSSGIASTSVEPDAMMSGDAAAAAAAASASAAAVCRVSARSKPELNVCGVCYEQFDTRWDDDTEDWLLQDCVELAGGIYHPVCAEDAAKSATDDANAESSEARVAASSSNSSTSAAATLLSILKEAVGLQ